MIGFFNKAEIVDELDDIGFMNMMSNIKSIADNTSFPDNTNPFLFISL